MVTGMRHYILRLDDACEKRDIEKWDSLEEILDKYVKIVGGLDVLRDIIFICLCFLHYHIPFMRIHWLH